MSKITSKVKTFLAGESGATSVEYAVMLALIMGICIAAITTLGVENGDLWADNDAQIATALN